MLVFGVSRSSPVSLHLSMYDLYSLSQSSS
jgi:hypothetical protein